MPSCSPRIALPLLVGTLAAGATGHLRLGLDPEGRFALRLEGGYLKYGHESQRTCLATTPACRIAVNVTTAWPRTPKS